MRKENTRQHLTGQNRLPAYSLPPVRQINAALLIITLILVCFGLVMLFSASMSDGYSREGSALFYVFKQSIITLVGLVIALLIALIIPVAAFDYFWLTLAVYLGTTGLLVYVKLFGKVLNGARRWLKLGPITFQPSELAKISLVFCFAGYFSWLRRRRRSGKLQFRSNAVQFFADGWFDILLPGAAILLWLALIIVQPHVSCVVIMLFVSLVLYLTAGIPLRSWLSALVQMLMLGTAVLLVFSFLAATKPKDGLQDAVNQSLNSNFAHVANRMENFLNPEAASADDLYQVNQSLIAIGSGGMYGVGLGEGRQKYNYLPEAHNDYVFAIIGEELGFSGTLTVLLLFVLFMLTGIGITRRSANSFCALLAGGYTMLISIQAFLNIGVATHTLPPTGISLPFFSYGGTSNLFFLVGIGLLLAVSRSGQRPQTIRGAGPVAKPVTRPGKVRSS